MLAITSTGVIVNAVTERQFIAKETDIAVHVGAYDAGFESPVVTINDITYVPLREFCYITNCMVEWNEEKRTVFVTDNEYVKMKDDLENDKEGILKNGRKYKFFGNNEQKFDIDNYVEENNLRCEHIYDFTIKEETIENTAERVQEFICDSPEIDELHIYYDNEKNSLLFRSYTTNKTVNMLDSHVSAIVLNCDSGKIYKYNRSPYDIK